MAHAGSIVTRGRGKGWVVATGASTAVGQLAVSVVGGEGGRAPLVERMERFTRFIAIAVIAAAVGLVVIGVGVRGFSLAEMFFVAVSLAVAAIPEGLPVSMTVALAVATSRMAKRGVIVRRLAAVEGLGSCTLIATDKTGTLTCNELTVRELVLPDGTLARVSGEGFRPSGEVALGGGDGSPCTREALRRLARVAALCNEADLSNCDGEWIARGDTVDVGFLVLAEKLGCSRESCLAELPALGRVPYEPERQFAASYHLEGARALALVKGAPERVVSLCDGSPEERREWLSHAEKLAAKGYRVLALAEGELPRGDVPLPAVPSGLAYLGLAAMIDPLRPGAREAVQACRRAGIRVCMITGDHKATALAIGRELGLADSESEVMTGRDIAERDEAALRDAVTRATAFARVSPEQKLQLVNAARAAGHYVAVTGDGVNDAPALKAANLGVAMGKSGTDVAKEAAQLVISDDNFATIVSGVEEGRIAYDNIRNVIYLLVSFGAAELLLVGLSVAAGYPVPLLPVQLLWLNLVTNGIQDVALALEPGENSVLDRPPRPPSDSIFDRLMTERMVVGSVVIGLTSFCAFKGMLDAGWSEPAARNSLLLLLVLFGTVHIGNCRSETKSALALSPFRSPVLLGGALAAFGVHLVSLYLPVLRDVLGTSSVSAREWAKLILLSLSVLLAMELHKLSWRLRRRGR